MPIRCATSACAIATDAPRADANGCSPVCDRETLIQVMNQALTSCACCVRRPVDA